VAEIRRERIDDTLAIRYVNDRAFGRPNEGAVIEQLRGTCGSLLSAAGFVGSADATRHTREAAAAAAP
jgi:predicted N-acetyltransferase YhbS